MIKIIEKATYKLDKVLLVDLLDEYKNTHSLWFVLSRSPMTFGSWEGGDALAHHIIQRCNLVSACDDWKKAYGN